MDNKKEIEETVKKILGFDIKVLTNKGEEKIIRFSDIKGSDYLNSTLSTSDDWDRTYEFIKPYTFKVIETRIECLDYSVEII